MQSILINEKITKDKILSLKDFKSLNEVRQYNLYADNILEGITLLNDLTLKEELMKLYGVLYEPMDQPVYVFIDRFGKYYAIKICGAYDK